MTAVPAGLALRVARGRATLALVRTRKNIAVQDIAAFVLVAMVLAVVAPALAALAVCPEDAEAECCGLDDSACVCCLQGPRIAWVGVIAVHGDASEEPIGAESSVTFLDSFPRDILHVPRIALAS